MSYRLSLEKVSSVFLHSVEMPKPEQTLTLPAEMRCHFSNAYSFQDSEDYIQTILEYGGI